jgi:hypothetical protein
MVAADGHDSSSSGKLRAIVSAENLRDDKAGTQGREATNSIAAVAPIPLPPARVDGVVRPPFPAGVEHANPGEAWPFTLAEAIRIALDNGEEVRVVGFEAGRLAIGGLAPTQLRTTEKDGKSQPAPMAIMPQNARASGWSFKSQVMAMLHAVEQQYWSLSQAHAIVSSAEQAVHSALEIHNREQKITIDRFLDAVAQHATAGNGWADDIASSQPRMGRQRVARRVNAGNCGADNIAGSQPRMGRHHVARRVNAGNCGADNIASSQPRMGRQGVARESRKGERGHYWKGGKGKGDRKGDITNSSGVLDNVAKLP